MLHILLTILKILGILLLAVLGILLFIILSVLFVPVCYGAQGRRTSEELYGKATVSWLFRLICARFEYDNGKTALEIFLFGVPLLAARRRLGAWKARRQAKKAGEPGKKTVKAERKLSVGKAEAETEQKRSGQTEEPERKQEEAARTTGVQSAAGLAEQQREQPSRPTVFRRLGGIISGIWRKVKAIFAAVWRLPGKIAERIRKIRLTFRGICDKIKQWYTFFQLDDTRQALLFLKEKGKGLLRHILPRKIRGKIVFGFEDPSLTGQVLAFAGAVYPLYRDSLQITPVFDRQVLEGEVKLRGRIFGVYLLWQAWQIYRNREVKVTYRRFQHKEA